jgi:hypothetical protein
VWVIGAWNIVHAPDYVDCAGATGNGTSAVCQHCDPVLLNFSLVVIIIDGICIGIVIIVIGAIIYCLSDNNTMNVPSTNDVVNCQRTYPYIYDVERSRSSTDSDEQYFDAEDHWPDDVLQYPRTPHIIDRSPGESDWI